MTIQIVGEETRCSQFMGYSLRLAARVILYTLSDRQNSTYHSLWYTGWNDMSTMKDRSDHPSLHKRTLYHGVTSHATLLFAFNDLKKWIKKWSYIVGNNPLYPPVQAVPPPLIPSPPPFFLCLLLVFLI